MQYFANLQLAFIAFHKFFYTKKIEQANNEYVAFINRTVGKIGVVILSQLIISFGNAPGPSPPA